MVLHREVRLSQWSKRISLTQKRMNFPGQGEQKRTVPGRRTVPLVPEEHSPMAGGCWEEHCPGCWCLKKSHGAGAREEHCPRLVGEAGSSGEAQLEKGGSGWNTKFSVLPVGLGFLHKISSGNPIEALKRSCLRMLWMRACVCLLGSVFACEPLCFRMKRIVRRTE